jgi:hypothetical protein
VISPSGNVEGSCQGEFRVGAASTGLENKSRQEYFVASKKHQGGGVDG